MKTVLALWQRNMKAFARDRVRLIISIIFPFFFVYVFSAIFRNEYIENPVTYMLAGVLISTVFDSSLRVSSSTIDDMVSGFMKEVLVSPINRLSIAFGQFLSSATVSTIQGAAILILGFFIGFKVTSPVTIILAFLAMMFIGLVFSGLGLFLATVTKSTQTFQVVTMAITMPMTFISGAYIPFSLLPQTLHFIGYINPMTYAVMLFRTISLEKMGLSQEDLILEELAVKVGDFIVTPLTSAFILFVFGGIFLVLSTLSFVNADFSKINRQKSEAIEF